VRGESLPTGSFMIRGKKNWLPPVGLVYGFAILFKVDRDGAARHMWDRRPWARGDDSLALSAAASQDEVDEEKEEDVVEPDITEESEEEEDDEEFDFPDTQIATAPVNTFPEAEKYNLEEIPVSDSEEVLIEPVNHVPVPRITGGQNANIKKTVEVTPPTSTRGKRGKQKKMKEKYGDQDDEDREMMKDFLAPDRGVQPKGKKAKAAAVKKAADEEKQVRWLAEQEKKKAEKEARTGQVVKEDISAGKIEIARLAEEQSVKLVARDLVATLGNIDSLTGCPHADDVLEYAMVVCAPWVTLSKYEYKVKLLPGAGKKGKTGKGALGACMRGMEEGRREFVGRVTESEVVGVMIGRSKIAGEKGDKGKRRG
jgi:hypothetical protein